MPWLSVLLTKQSDASGGGTREGLLGASDKIISCRPWCRKSMTKNKHVSEGQKSTEGRDITSNPSRHIRPQPEEKGLLGGESGG